MRRAGKIIGIAAAVCVAAFAALLVFLTAAEYRPAAVESVGITEGAGGSEKKDTPGPGTELTVVSWNAGYGALGDNADFFMDGGHMVVSADRERVNANLGGIADRLGELDADVVFLQEVDEDSARSHGIDEVSFFRSRFGEMDSAFAPNFRAKFVPYPLPPIGRVSSGILTFSDFGIRTAERLRLPCPFKWPVRLANLKRCLLVTRIPAGEDGRELVLVNLHLEAYDDGEGKIEQTRMLKEFLQEEASKGSYVIAGGDFNQSFSSVDISAYEAQEGKWAPGLIDTGEFGEDWQFLMDAETPSCRSLDQPYAGADRASFQYYVIDGFIVSANIEVESFGVLDEAFRCTDHNPAVMKIRLL